MLTFLNFFFKSLGDKQKIYIVEKDDYLTPNDL